MKLAWITDPHFDCASKRKLKKLGYRLTEEAYDGLIITGDISDGRPTKYLHRIRRFFSGNIFFVLGNHDFYHSSIMEREIELSNHHLPKTFYLTRALPMELSPNVGLVGDDGWYDARNGTVNLDKAQMRDFREIMDLRRSIARGGDAKPAIRSMFLQEDIAAIADRAIARFTPKLLEAVKRYRTVLVATHFPPFVEVADHFGERNPNLMPFYSSKVMGNLLYRTALENPDTRIIVMCGHVHCENFFQPADNLEVFSGFGDYFKLFIHRTLVVTNEGVRLETPAQQEIAPDLVDNRIA